MRYVLKMTDKTRHMTHTRETRQVGVGRRIAAIVPPRATPLGPGRDRCAVIVSGGEAVDSTSSSQDRQPRYAGHSKKNGGEEN